MADRPTPSAHRFDEIFQSSDDPWGFRTRWYEARKRSLTVAALPSLRYARGYEPGCANGELSAHLADRCDSLLVSDMAGRAVQLAKSRLQGLSHVQVMQARLPEEWPAGTFDLIVISELGYFLNVQDLDALIDRARESLLPGGTVLACHWRRPITGCELQGDAVHARIHEGLRMSSLCEVREADFVLQVWSTDTRSVAEREGFDW